MGRVLVTAPSVEPLSLTEAKAFLRVTFDDDDALIAKLVAGARARAEERQGRAYLTQTWDLYLDAFPGSEEAIEIPLPPLLSITSVTYTTSADVPVVLAASEYYVDSVTQPGRILPAFGKSWPSDTLRIANGVVVRFVAGYGPTAADVPPKVLGAFRKLLAHYYVARDITTEIPQGIAEELWEGYARQFA